MHTVALARLHNQRIIASDYQRPADVVAWLGAVQAQEYEHAKWGLGLRMRDGLATATVERAFEAGRILRTHVLRPTWHFVTPRDIRWLLDLTAARVRQRMAPYNRRLELDARTLARGAQILERALGEGRPLTRAELAEHLRRGRLPMTGIRLALLVMDAELEGVICSGPRRGNQFTYALLADRAPKARRMTRDEALGELSLRYFRSHGPATIRDFVWWSGLTTADARRGLEIAEIKGQECDGRNYWSAGQLENRAQAPLVHLLPIYDEYLVAYRDRDAVPHGPMTIPSGSFGPVRFQHALVVDGQVIGTWRTSRTSCGTGVQVTLLRPLKVRERRALDNVIDRYAGFLAAPVTLTMA